MKLFVKKCNTFIIENNQQFYIISIYKWIPSQPPPPPHPHTYTPSLLTQKINKPVLIMIAITVKAKNSQNFFFGGAYASGGGLGVGAKDWG